MYIYKYANIQELQHSLKNSFKDQSSELQKRKNRSEQQIMFPYIF